jgi:hypothetical protein
MALLGRPWALHNIDDVERFASRIVERRRLHWLQPHERDDLLTYPVEAAWELSLRWQPNGYAFSQWARPTLERRTTDWLRSTFFDARYVSEPPELVSLDDSEHDELGAALAGSSVDDGSYRLADQLRCLQARSRRPGRGDGRLG